MFIAVLVGGLTIGPGVLSAAADSTGYPASGANGTGLPGAGAPPLLDAGSPIPWTLVAFLVIAGAGATLIVYVISRRQETNPD